MVFNADKNRTTFLTVKKLLFIRFGVCCLFVVSSTSTTISENCTYIQNPSYPSVYSETSSLTYTINKCAASVCSVRLDFETFATAGPTSTAEATGGVCTGTVCIECTIGSNLGNYRLFLQSYQVWSSAHCSLQVLYSSVYIIIARCYEKSSESGCDGMINQ